MTSASPAPMLKHAARANNADGNALKEDCARQVKFEQTDGIGTLVVAEPEYERRLAFL